MSAFWGVRVTQRRGSPVRTQRSEYERGRRQRQDPYWPQNATQPFNCTGYTLLEIILTLTIMAAVYTLALPCASSMLYHYRALMTLHQLETTLNYARSVAIRNQVQTIICPSDDAQTCGTQWHGGLLVIALHKRVGFYKLPLGKRDQLTLGQSGFSPYNIVIEANGLTNYNGSFNYKSLKLAESAQFKLYFNKALRLYMVKVDG